MPEAVFQRTGGPSEKGGRDPRSRFSPKSGTKDHTPVRGRSLRIAVPRMTGVLCGIGDHVVSGRSASCAQFATPRKHRWENFNRLQDVWGANSNLHQSWVE